MNQLYRSIARPHAQVRSDLVGAVLLVVIMGGFSNQPSAAWRGRLDYTQRPLDMTDVWNWLRGQDLNLRPSVL